MSSRRAGEYLVPMVTVLVLSFFRPLALQLGGLVSAGACICA